MDRRRVKQVAYNEEHGITPTSIVKAIAEREGIAYEAEDRKKRAAKVAEETGDYMTGQDIKKSINKLKKQMKAAADIMDFEEAALYRDRLLALERRQIEEGW